MVTMMKGIFSRPCWVMVASSLAMSTLPLKGCRLSGQKASSMTQFTGIPPALKAWARVVSKGMLKGRIWPGFTNVPKTTFSAARPWCVGMT